MNSPPKKLLKEFFESHLNIVAVDIPEADRLSAICLVDDLAKANGIDTAYCISPGSKITAPLYDKENSIIHWNTSVEKEFGLCNESNIINYYLQQFRKYDKAGIFIFLDWQFYLEDNHADPVTLSLLKTIACEVLETIKNRKLIVLLGQNIDFDKSLSRQIPVINLGLPSRETILFNLKAQDRFLGATNDARWLELAEAAVGLTFYEISCLIDIGISLSESGCPFEFIKQAFERQKFQNQHKEKPLMASVN